MARNPATMKPVFLAWNSPGPEGMQLLRDLAGVSALSDVFDCMCLAKSRYDLGAARRTLVDLSLAGRLVVVVDVLTAKALGLSEEEQGYFKWTSGLREHGLYASVVIPHVEELKCNERKRAQAKVVVRELAMEVAMGQLSYDRFYSKSLS